MRIYIVITFLFLLGIACRQQQKEKLFQKLYPAETGIDFVNTITESKEHNVFTYQYYYNGNGVAAGDINSDGKTDIFITGNQTPSKLFINKGNFKFEDATATAGVAGKNAWRTGANMVDINGDGLLDIYVCYSGFGSEEDRANQLFINTGNNNEGVPVFNEKAAEYGIDAPGTYTSQAAFFDFDRDGDLDMFLLNHANEFYSPFFNTKRLRTLRHPQYGNRLYRNDEGHFTDVSDKAGIFGGGNNFGLGIAISDINGDGWADVLVSNDFHEQDYFYLNNQDGTFKEVCQQLFAHMSRNTMGLDIADFNNDLMPDVVTLDMLPESNYRQKILQGPDEYDKYTLMVDSGYGRQQNRNMLQLNRGTAPNGLPVFSEIGQLSGVSNTDWSWAALFADFDNDGLKDLFVTNGYLHESTNLDFMRYEVAEELEKARSKGLDVSTPQGYMSNMPLYDLVKKMPSTRISNYMYRNKGDLTFSDESKNWGLDEEGVSSGATYADLDNDGDLDLIVCNNNDPVWVYKNNSNEIEKNNFIKVKLAGDRKNLFGLDAKVIVTTDKGEQMQEMCPARGYQSSVDYTLSFGLGKQQRIKEIKVFWARDSATIVSNPVINTTVLINKHDAVAINNAPGKQSALFTDITSESGIDFVQQENEYVDFKWEYLIPYELSKQGPKMAKGDVNNDGFDDFFIGGPAGQSGVLYIQSNRGKFKPAKQQPWQADAISEDISSVFFDADNDGDQDLYVVSGGNEWLMPGPELQDRLYINDGNGNFTKAINALPEEFFSGSCVIANDFDKDGDLDLFVGARCIPGYYPMSAGNTLLRNDFSKSSHQVHFTDVTKIMGGDELFKAGMVADAIWNDLDSDGWQDLIVVGDWMPISIFHNDAGKKFTNITAVSALDKSNGWWCKVVPADIDHDGDIDLIAGNLGSNTQFKVSNEEPLVTYAADFDNNGRVDPVMTWFVQHASFPYNTRDEITGQMPVLNKKFLRYADYGNATISDILTKGQIEKAKKFYIYQTKTCLFINQGGRFVEKVLPIESQFSMMNGILFKDYDADGKEDILLTGNFCPFRVQQGPCDANIGLLLKGDDKGNFSSVNRDETGLYVPGDVRDMLELKTSEGAIIVVSKNNGAVQVLKVKSN
ncbi:MAG TPA: VCBS repeat-containing protein [Chitinophagaceae bacterium]|nr:VCBS repeat-containing protein [Chitinophagaceae bacterium]